MSTIWPWTWKEQRDEYRKSLDFYRSIDGWVGNIVSLVYCAAIIYAMLKLRAHMDWKP